MIPNNLIFISAQPIDEYFLWQIEVQIVNFRKVGISDKMHVIVWYPKQRNVELGKWKALNEKYPEVSIFYYEDVGADVKLYIPQVRPNCLKQHFAAFPNLNKNTFFYHDSDIIFNYLPNFEKLLQSGICWQSNTSSYLDYSYIIRKEEQGKIPNNEALLEFSRIGGIDVAVIKDYDGKTGGAQYILKGIDANFWQDVEDIASDVRKTFSHHLEGSINRRYFTSENEGFQSWCADMWGVNFSLWKRGIVTNITDDLEFSWAVDSMDVYNRKPIYHNAGADGSNPEMFYKGAWIKKSPIGETLPSNPAFASYMYVQAIKEVK